MSNKLKLTKFALSTALLVSIVANPAISEAANTTKNTQSKTVQTLQKNVLDNSFKDIQIAAVANSFSNPLDLAKKYAPDTAEDWTKTLDLYEKTFGAVQNNVISTVDGVNVTLEGSDYIILTSTPISKSTLSEDIPTEEVVSLGGSISLLSSDSVPFTDSVSTTDDVSMIKTEIMMDDANDPHLAFFNAQIALEKAVESKDESAIKQSLSKLLEQYKTQISQS